MIDKPTPDTLEARRAMTLYAINDVFAPTKLLFHLNHDIISSYQALIPTATSSITQQSVPEAQPLKPSDSTAMRTYFALSDSHIKFMDPLITTPDYHVIIHSVPGLRWRDPSNANLCAHSLIQAPSISTHLTSSTAIMLLIGTNSLRHLDATHVLTQVAYTIFFASVNIILI